MNSQYFKMFLALILLLLPVAAEAQSAIGRKSSYHAAWPSLEYECERSVTIGVHDQRPYIIDDNKSPTYAGTMRGGFGNPWDMNTQSGNPLSDDIALAVSSGFKRVGTPANTVAISYKDDSQTVLSRLKAAGAERIVLITLTEFRSDQYARAGFFIEATLRVYDKDGKQLGCSSTSHKDIGSGDGTVQSPEDAARLHLSRLLNAPAVRAALTEVKK